MVVVFIDQLEELLTLATQEHRSRFAELLAWLVDDARLRVLVTRRADFLSQCAAEPTLAALLELSTFVLGPRGPPRLRI